MCAAVAMDEQIPGSGEENFFDPVEPRPVWNMSGMYLMLLRCCA